MKDTVASSQEYVYIKASELRPILQGNPLWYVDTPVADLIEKYIFSSTPEGDGRQDWIKGKSELISLVAQMWEDDELYLGEAEEGFNDDDRWGGRFNPNKEKERPDTVVIHHTSTSEDISIAELETLGILRLYVPIYRNKFPDYSDSYTPISSGHFRDGKQTFIGYHYVIFSNGDIFQALDDDYTGMQAGDYPTNCRSWGIAFVADLTSSEPTPKALTSGENLIHRLAPSIVVGHNEVVHKGNPVDTVCPGNVWEKWGKTLGSSS